jgi:hypothetical protein
MRKKIEEYKKTMINKILASKTQLEVLNLIDRKIKMLHHNNASPKLVQDFLDASTNELKQLDSSEFHAQQYSNIRVAKHHLENLKSLYIRRN